MSRAPAGAVAAALAVLAGLVGCADRDGGAPARAPRAAPMRWGADLFDAAPPDAALLAALAELGIRDVRVGVRWAEVERERGRVDWRALDALDDEISRAGLGWVATVHTSPAWSRRDPEPPAHWWLCRDVRPDVASPAAARAGPPTDPDDLARFAAALARRYAGGLVAVEVWREPNLMPNWRAGGPDPEDYARLLGPVADAVHALAPSVRVVSAAAAPTTTLDPCSLDDVVFLDRLARTGALSQVDAVGIAPLGMRAPPEARADPDALGAARAELLHAAVAAAGADAPLWALSYGWTAGFPAGAAEAPGEALGAGLSSSTAAAFLRRAGARATFDQWWLEALFVSGLVPAGKGGPAGRPPDGAGGGSGPLVPPLARAVKDLAGGKVAPPPPAPAPSWPRRGAWGAALLVLVVGSAVAVRRRLAAPVARLLAPVTRGPWPIAAGAYATLAIVLAAAAPCASGAACDLAPRLAWPFGAAALGGLALLAAARPTLALAAVAAGAPFASTLRLAIGPVPVAAGELLVALAVGGRCAAWYLGRPSTKRPAPRALDGLVALLVAWSAVTLLWAPRFGPAAREWRTVLLEPALFYALLRTSPDRPGAARAAAAGLVAGGAVAAAVGLGQVIAHALHAGAWAVAAEGVLRARGPYGSPNNLALLLGRVGMLLAAVAVGDSARGARWVRWAAGGALALVAAGWLATFSRGALLLGLPAGAAVLALRHAPHVPRRRLLATAAAVLAALALAVAPFAGTERVRGALSVGPGATGYYRLQLWHAAGRMVADQPLRGVGLDGFQYAYRTRYVPRDVIQERFLSHPHDVVLDWWTRLGLPGLAALLALVGLTVRAARRAPRRGPGATLATGALAMQAYGLGHGLVDNAFFLVDLALATWCAQAMLLAALEEDVGPPGFEPGTYRL